MFRVDYRFSGQGLWSTPALPVSLQVAIGQARAKGDSPFADEVRVAQAGVNALPTTSHVVDLLL